MSIIGFICPDEETTTFKDCFEHCRMSERCMSVATLKAMAEQRPNDRPPSTTELLSGTCESYLKRTEDYFIDPQERAFAIMGTIHHLNLEHNDLPEDKYLQEQKLEGFNITGILDFYDVETKTLIDYKNTGSFKAAKVLGLAHRLVPDPLGSKYKRSGKWGKAGTIKKVKEFYEDENLKDFGDWGFQVNMYRYLLEQQGHEVEHMKLQMNVRDAGTYSAKDRGVSRNIYFVDIPFIDNDILIPYFIDKRDRLLQHLSEKTLPEKCSDKETWEGNKCRNYCEVRHLCPHIN
tara:strand:- start:584 stop:1453 length:870 start_codon:yes stop_codon:yes gene_type:complete